MNISNSQEHYNEFFETFFNYGWSIHSQKIYELDNKQVIGSELLLRVGDEDNYLDNSVFFPKICEDSRYLSVSKEVLNLVKIRFIHNPEIFFEKTFINISPNEIRSEAILLLLQELGELFEESNKTLVIELSEIFTREDFVELKTSLDKLNSNFVELAIDDYGRGLIDHKSYKSLNLSYLKLDKSVSNRMQSNEGLINVIIKFCKQYEILCIAEGIESPESENTLLNQGIPLGQGFYFHKPELFIKP